LSDKFDKQIAVSSVLPAVVQLHAEEAAFLWHLRDDVIRQPHYNLAEIAELDNRVEAHLDGLRVNGEPAWQTVKEQAEQFGEAGEVFAATVLALESGERDRLEPLFALAGAAPELERPLISAFGWTSAPVVSGLMRALMSSAAPSARRVAVAAQSIRREDLGQSWPRLLHDDDPRVRARAIRAAAELGKHDALSELRQFMNDKDPACRFWAASSAARLGDRSTAVSDALRDIAVQAGPFQERAIGMTVRTTNPGDVRDWLRPFWKDVKTLRLAAAGIAASGNVDFVPVLLQIMQVDAAARPAGEAFTMISGVHLSYDKLERDQPEDFQAGPTEDPADENVAMDQDENLPWPDLKLVEKWWAANSSRFTSGRRYLCGHEISRASLVQVLREGYQRQRAAAALELALLEPARPIFEVRARGDWQQKLLPLWYPAS
jgi:uncharacterized protein (TIGR02270 family)